MTQEGRNIVLRVMMRLAIAYGDATAEVMREHSPELREVLRSFEQIVQERISARIWQKGCHQGWRQLRILHDTGHVVPAEDLRPAPPCSSQLGG
jgi:hypothetical protein